MRRFLPLVVIATLWFSPSTSWAQGEKKPAVKPATLEQLQAETLKNNHHIKVAEAKLRLAEAELVRTRADLKHQIAIAHADFEAALAAEEEGLIRLKTAKFLFEKKCISREDYSSALVTYSNLKTNRIDYERRLNQLLGRPAVEKTPPPKK